jgi:hypothetical protein
MQAVGREVVFDPAEVATWFHEGTDALRVVALNLMIAGEDCRDFLAVLEVVNAPRSLFEQFYGLILGQQMLSNLANSSSAYWAQHCESPGKAPIPSRRVAHEPKQGDHLRVGGT